MRHDSSTRKQRLCGGGFVPKVPPEGRVPLDRFHQISGATRRNWWESSIPDRGEASGGWGTVLGGWLGRRHTSCHCLLARGRTTNQVASLDEFYRTPKPRKSVYRHIEGNWYVWADCSLRICRCISCFCLRRSYSVWPCNRIRSSPIAYGHFSYWLVTGMLRRQVAVAAPWRLCGASRSRNSFT